MFFGFGFFSLHLEGKLILEYRNLQPKDILFLHSALGAAIIVKLSAFHVLLCNLPLLRTHYNCSPGFLWQGFSEQYFSPCFILLVSHGFPHGLVPTNPHTDHMDGSHGMQLPSAWIIALHAPFLHLILWFLVNIRENQIIERSKVDSGYVLGHDYPTKHMHKSLVPTHMQCLCATRHATVSMKNIMHGNRPQDLEQILMEGTKYWGTKIVMATTTIITCCTVEGDAHLA